MKPYWVWKHSRRWTWCFVLLQMIKKTVTAHVNGTNYKPFLSVKYRGGITGTCEIIIRNLAFIANTNKPWQALTVPLPVGIISSLGRRHGMQFPTVSTLILPYWIVTWYLIQLIKPSPHVQLKQAPENQFFPCSLTIPFSSVQAGRESLVQVIFPSRQLHLVLLLLSHSCLSAKAFPWKSQQPVCVLVHETWKFGVHLQVKSGLGFKVCPTS